MKYKLESDIGESDQRLRVGLCRDLDVASDGLVYNYVHSGYGETDKTGDGASPAKEKMSVTWQCTVAPDPGPVAGMACQHKGAPIHRGTTHRAARSSEMCPVHAIRWDCCERTLSFRPGNPLYRPPATLTRRSYNTSYYFTNTT